MSSHCVLQPVNMASIIHGIWRKSTRFNTCIKLIMDRCVLERSAKIGISFFNVINYCLNRKLCMNTLKYSHWQFDTCIVDFIHIPWLCKFKTELNICQCVAEQSKAPGLKANSRQFDSQWDIYFHFEFFHLLSVPHSSAKPIQMKSSMKLIQSNRWTEVDISLN